MARDETPPFERGFTYYNGGTIDANNLGGVNLEGKEWRIEDTIYGTGQYVTLRCVRNVAAVALLPKRLVKFSLDAFYGCRVNGYTNVSPEGGFPVDERLPAAGVAVNDLFYIVVQGPALVLTDIASGAGSVFAVGDPLVSLTGATSGATTAGRVRVAAVTGLTGVPIRDELLNVIGRAVSAKTTAQTAADMLIIVNRWL